MMQNEYVGFLYDTAGDNYAHVNDFVEFEFTLVSNDVGLCQFVVLESNPVLDVISLDDEIRIKREDIETVIFTGLYRGYEKHATNNNGFVTLLFESLESILQKQIVAYPNDQAHSLGVFTDRTMAYIINILVTYNCIPGNDIERKTAIRDNRLDSVTIIDPGTAIYSLSLAWENVLTALQKLSAIEPFDFWVINDAPSGTRQFYARFPAGAWNRSLDGYNPLNTYPIVFSLESGTITSFSTARYSIGEKTVAVIGGPGESSARLVETRTGDNYDADRNFAEMFVDARSSGTISAMQSAGESALASARATEKTSFDTLIMSGKIPLYHYYLNDRITVEHNGEQLTRKITAITMRVSSSGDSVSLETKEWSNT